MIGSVKVKPGNSDPAAAEAGTERGWGAITTYFLLACAFSWTWWLYLLATGQTVGGDGSATHFPGLLGPMMAAFVVTVATTRRAGMRWLFASMVRWRGGLVWWGVAISPLGYLALAAVIVRLTSDAWPDWSAFGRINGLPDAGVLATLLSLVLVNGFGEETGWRGFALPLLQQRFDPLVASLAVVPMWAFWHLPIFWLLESWRGFGAVTLSGWLVGLTCGSILLAWLYNRTGGSVLLVAVWHGTYNLAAGTEGAMGTIAAIVTTLVIAQTVLLVWLELRRRHRGGRTVLGSGQ